MPYSTRHTVVTIVDKNKVEEVVAVIKQSARTGRDNIGIIVISDVEDILLI
jgi:nitrogen regulatory protein PII